MRRNVLILVAAAVFVAVALLLVWSEMPWSTEETPPVDLTPSEVESESGPPTAARPAMAEPAEQQPPPQSTVEVQSAPIVLPSLPDSDPFVRARLEDFGLPEQWTMQDGLVRRFAVLTDSVTRGDWPRRPLRFLRPPGEFEVVERNGRLYPDPNNTRRFDAGMSLLESIDPAAAADFLVLIDPLLVAAIEELGLPTDGPDPVLEAIDSVLAAPEVAGDLELVRPKVFYEYADPALEALPAFDKQLVRLGPKNVARLKAYLTRLRAELDRRDA